MSISVFDLFSIGIGPSSSHTVGPMRAARNFVNALVDKGKLTQITRIQVELYGSLALTGQGHGTDKAIIMGLTGEAPESIDPDSVGERMQTIITSQQLPLPQQHSINFNYNHDLIFNTKEFLPQHSNGMRFTAYDSKQNVITTKVFFSIGGGFILSEQDIDNPTTTTNEVPYPFATAKELLQLCKQHHLTIHELMLANEKAWRDEQTIHQQIAAIANTMNQCVQKGCEHSGILPGGLKVERRAPMLYRKLKIKGKPTSYEQSDAMNWLNMYAMAVNEENAAGGRVVTAPTNGAAGVIPAVLTYYQNFYPQVTSKDTEIFLLTAGAIAILYKKGASISGAEVGCQGEVGVASSMAAAALTAVLGGTLAQIENAAEIAMEHHLGMTCDPVNGLVQIPCIERNAMGAVKAVNAMRLAMLGDGSHHISLDKVIATMLATGKDMKTIYKETSLGGLAVNVIEC